MFVCEGYVPTAVRHHAGEHGPAVRRLRGQSGGGGGRHDAGQPADDAGRPAGRHVRGAAAGVRTTEAAAAGLPGHAAAQSAPAAAVHAAGAQRDDERRNEHDERDGGRPGRARAALLEARGTGHAGESLLHAHNAQELLIYRLQKHIFYLFMYFILTVQIFFRNINALT